MLGFETIGNATLVCHDGAPVLATDPWFEGSAYFGSWGLANQVPDRQRSDILACPFIWLSHGHPDHLNLACLDQVAGSTILLPDHVGGRIQADLTQAGFSVRVLRDRTWNALSDRIQVMSLSDANQDAALLVNIHGRLIVNLNDCSQEHFFWKHFVRNVMSKFETRFLLKIAGYGDANMINYFDDRGHRIEPRIKNIQVGAKIQFFTDYYRPTYFLPFSSFHRYQRSDSLWANEYTTPLSAYRDGWSSTRTQMLPPHIAYNCEDDTWTAISPPSLEAVECAPEEFGDCWSDPLESSEERALRAYFERVENLWEALDFVTLRVGGRETTVSPRTRRFERGVTFELPRQSLMTAVEHRVFDDLLIGNFMKTTLHGHWETQTVYPHLAPTLSKYADNAGVLNRAQFQHYLAQYKRRAPITYLLHRLGSQSQARIRPFLENHPDLLHTALRGYQWVRGGWRA